MYKKYLKDIIFLTIILFKYYLHIYIITKKCEFGEDKFGKCLSEPKKKFNISKNSVIGMIFVLALALILFGLFYVITYDLAIPVCFVWGMITCGIGLMFFVIYGTYISGTRKNEYDRK